MTYVESNVMMQTQMKHSSAFELFDHPRQILSEAAGGLATKAYLHRPTGDSACSWQIATVVVGDSMRFTPAATAAEASPLSRLLCAMWAATRDDEQAVSVLMQGPVKPNR